MEFSSYNGMGRWNVPWNGFKMSVFSFPFSQSRFFYVTNVSSVFDASFDIGKLFVPTFINQIKNMFSSKF